MAEIARYVLAAFVVLHGLVHLLYFGQSARFFQLQQGMDWPDQSWALSQFASSGTIRGAASAACVLAAAGFVVAGAGLFADATWWRGMLAVAAAFSTTMWILFWDASASELSSQGAVAILINAALLAAVLAFPQAQTA